MSPRELVEASVNKHGELHLDKERTEVLLRWLTHCETYEEGTKRLFDDLCQAMKPLGIVLGKGSDAEDKA